MEHYQREFLKNNYELNRQQTSLEQYINQYKAQAKQNYAELQRYSLDFPTISEKNVGLVPSIFPPKPFQP